MKTTNQLSGLINGAMNGAIHGPPKLQNVEIAVNNIYFVTFFYGV